MDLKSLCEWTKEMQKKETLAQVVRKDAKGAPREGDITVCVNLLGELRNRIQMVQDHTKKAQKYESDILEYLATLETRGVKFVEHKPEPAKTMPATPEGSGQSGPTPPVPEPKKVLTENPYDKKRTAK